MIHLDTIFLIQALKPGSPEDRRLRRWAALGGVGLKKAKQLLNVSRSLSERVRV